MTRRTHLLFPALLLAASCSPQLDEGSVGDDEVRTLSVPEPGALPSDYRARAATLRLFGTQSLEDSAAASATLADTATWSTRTYRQGDPIARNLIVAAIREDSIDLSGVAQRLTLRVGDDVSLRLIDHVFDTAAIDQGRHVISTAPATISQIRARYGVGATADSTTFADHNALRLSAIQPQSALDRLGFHEGDLLFAIDGADATAADLATLVERIATPGGTGVAVLMLRGPSLWEASFVPR